MKINPSSKDWKLCHLLQWKLQQCPLLCFPVLELLNSAANKQTPIIPSFSREDFLTLVKKPEHIRDKFLLAHLHQTHAPSQSPRWLCTSPQAEELGLLWKSACPLHQSWKHSGQGGQEPLCKSPVITQTLAQGSLRQRERWGNSLSCLSPEQHSSCRLVHEV